MHAALTYSITACTIFIHSIGAASQDLARLEIKNLRPMIASTETFIDDLPLPPGFRMRRTGKSLTIVGAALLLSGTIVYANTNTNDFYKVTYYGGTTHIEYDNRGLAGQAMIGAGLGMAIPGIILWHKGAKKYKQYLQRETAFNFRARGFSVTYKF